MSRVLVAVVAALAFAGVAHAAGRVALPSPLAPLSIAPPLAGGATASAENARHSITASTRVVVSIDEAGKPFAATATQRLDVRGAGDYFFTIGAPVITVRAPAGSESIPGMRTGSILWAGFDPGRRLLVARATLDPPKVAALLPLRIVATSDTVTLENATRVSVGAFSADAPRAPVAAYLAQLRTDVAHGRTPQQTTVPVSSDPVATRVTVEAPLHVAGTIGEHRIDLVLTDSVRIRARGKIDLRVEPVARVAVSSSGSGRALLRAAIRATLAYARTHQYQEFLGNPDPLGTSHTTFAYRTASPPHAAPIASVGPSRGRWVTTTLVVCVLAVALVGGAALWSRS
jgi:hypothetical protein